MWVISICFVASEAGAQKEAPSADSLRRFDQALEETVAESVCGLRSSTGVLVAGRVDYTPAVEAELGVGDVIRSVNGTSLTSAYDLRQEIERFKPGTAVVLEIERQGRFRFVSFDME